MRSNRELKSNTPSDHIVVGVVRGSRGLRGELRVECTTEIFERFDVGNDLFLDGKTHTIVSSRFDRRGVLLRLNEIEDRDQADLCRGLELSIQEDEAVISNEGYFHHEIIGLSVYEVGAYLGVISEIIETGANDVYVVNLAEEDDILLPVIDGVILSVDLDQRSMEVEVPVGLGRNKKHVTD